MQDDTTNTNEVEEVVADEPQVADTTVEETPVEETVEEAPKEESEESPKETVTEKAEEKPEQPSRRETLRVQSLLKKYGTPKNTDKPEATKKLDYSTLEAEQETIDKLETDRQAYSDSAYQQGVAHSEVREWKRDLKYDAPNIEKAYPFLDPNDKANFNEAAADAMNQKYLRFVGYDKGDSQRNIPESVQYSEVSYKEFVESEMEFVDELANQKIATSTKNIAKQAASTGIRPDGSSAKKLNLNQDPSSMSLEELYAASGLKQHKQ